MFSLYEMWFPNTHCKVLEKIISFHIKKPWIFWYGSWIKLSLTSLKLPAMTKRFSSKYPEINFQPFLVNAILFLWKKLLKKFTFKKNYLIKENTLFSVKVTQIRCRRSSVYFSSNVIRPFFSQACIELIFLSACRKKIETKYLKKMKKYS